MSSIPKRGSILAALAMGAASLLACGSDASTREEGVDPPEASEVAQPSEGSPEGATGVAPTSAEPEPEPVPAEACEVAQACCPAFVSAQPQAARTEAAEACETLAMAMQLEGQPRDEACQGALEGFRSALRASGVDLPAACR